MRKTIVTEIVKNDYSNIIALNKNKKVLSLGASVRNKVPYNRREGK